MSTIVDNEGEGIEFIEFCDCELLVGPNKVKSPLIERLLLYISLTINLFIAFEFSKIISVVKSLIRFDIILHVDST